MEDSKLGRVLVLSSSSTDSGNRLEFVMWMVIVVGGRGASEWGLEEG